MGRNKKLSAPEVQRVKEMLWQGSAQQDVAAHFGVSQATVSRIQTGEQWTHVRWPDGSSGPLPVEREQQIIAQRFPGVAVRGIINRALDSGLSVEEIAARVQGQVDADDELQEAEGLGLITLEDTGDRDTVTRKKEQINLVTPKQWNAFKKMFPAAWWKDVPPDDRVKQTAVYLACTAEGADELPGAILRKQIDALEEKIRAR